MTISEAIQILSTRLKNIAWLYGSVEREQNLEAIDMAIEALSEDKWIPIQYHEITKEEREENGYPKDWVYFLDCVMPQDDQEILVQVKNGEIRWDVCYEDDGFSLDSGWDWKDDIVAWMPLPKPYREESER